MKARPHLFLIKGGKSLGKERLQKTYLDYEKLNVFHDPEKKEFFIEDQDWNLEAIAKAWIDFKHFVREFEDSIPINKELEGWEEIEKWVKEKDRLDEDDIKELDEWDRKAILERSPRGMITDFCHHAKICGLGPVIALTRTKEIVMARKSNPRILFKGFGYSYNGKPHSEEKEIAQNFLKKTPGVIYRETGEKYWWIELKFDPLKFSRGKELISPKIIHLEVDSLQELIGIIEKEFVNQIKEMGFEKFCEKRESFMEELIPEYKELKIAREIDLFDLLTRKTFYIIKKRIMKQNL